MGRVSQDGPERSPRPCRRMKPGRAADDDAKRDAKIGGGGKKGREVADGEVVRADCAVVDGGDGQAGGDLQMGGRKLTMPTRRWWDREIGEGGTWRDGQAQQARHEAGQSIAKQQDQCWSRTGTGTWSQWEPAARDIFVAQGFGDQTGPPKKPIALARLQATIFFFSGARSKAATFFL